MELFSGLPAIAAQFPRGFEIIILLVIVAILLLLGPKKIPELARGIGKALGEFRRGRAEVEKELKRELAETSPGGGSEAVIEISPRILEAAKQLGLDVVGKKERTLKVNILNAVEKATKADLEAVGKVLGLKVQGLGFDQLKDDIADALGL